jgi:hypothetical protein
MSTIPETVQSPAQHNTVLLFVLLMISATLHWIVLSYVLPLFSKTKIFPQTDYTLNISLKPIAPDVAHKSETVARQITAANPIKPLLNSPKSHKKQGNTSIEAPNSALRLNRQSIKETIETTLQLQDHSGYTQSGAVVMNGSLLSTLNQSSQKIGPLNSTSPMTSYDGGAWSDFIKMGDKCFRVEAANPLDELSVEKWYRVACR